MIALDKPEQRPSILPSAYLLEILIEGEANWMGRSDEMDADVSKMLVSAPFTYRLAWSFFLFA